MEVEGKTHSIARFRKKPELEHKGDGSQEPPAKRSYVLAAQDVHELSINLSDRLKLQETGIQFLSKIRKADSAIQVERFSTAFAELDKDLDQIPLILILLDISKQIGVPIRAVAPPMAQGNIPETTIRLLSADVQLSTFASTQDPATLGARFLLDAVDNINTISNRDKDSVGNAFVRYELLRSYVLRSHNTENTRLWERVVRRKPDLDKISRLLNALVPNRPQFATQMIFLLRKIIFHYLDFLLKDEGTRETTEEILLSCQISDAGLGDRCAKTTVVSKLTREATERKKRDPTRFKAKDGDFVQVKIIHKPHIDLKKVSVTDKEKAGIDKLNLKYQDLGRNFFSTSEIVDPLQRVAVALESVEIAYKQAHAIMERLKARRSIIRTRAYEVRAQLIEAKKTTLGLKDKLTPGEWSTAFTSLQKEGQIIELELDS